MKSVKIVIGLVAFLAINSSFAGGFSMSPRQSNYQQFVNSYRGDIIDARLNTVAPAFVYGATNALRADGTRNLADPDVATYLWRCINNVVNYYANLPANSNNRDFKTRIWQSLVRSLDELARMQQPMVQQPVINQSVQISAENGVKELRDFRLKTSGIIETTPTYFYSAGAIQAAWLREALYLLTDRGSIPITMQNRLNLQEALAGTAVELMRQILHKDPRNLSGEQKDAILQMIRGQVEQFMNTQGMRSRM